MDMLLFVSLGLSALLTLAAVSVAVSE